ncbi:unnamed protein product [Rotaria sp. Silwood1]|nr:unnamed protein product [Rotaria sp. Silwood1]
MTFFRYSLELCSQCRLLSQQVRFLRRSTYLLARGIRRSVERPQISPSPFTNLDQNISVDDDNNQISIQKKTILLDLVLTITSTNTEQTTKTFTDYNSIYKLPHLHPVEQPHDSSSINFKNSKTKNTSLSVRRKRSPSITSEHNASSSDDTDKKNYLTIEQLKDFLEKEQHMEALSIEDCSKLIAKFEPSLEGKKYEEMGIDGLRLLLLHDEFCIMNPNKSYRIYQDMTQPLTDYFIATSHNTYIRDNQVYGDCTPETYIHALRTGCRAVESKLLFVRKILSIHFFE